MVNERQTNEPGCAARIKVAFFAEILTEGLDGAVRTMYQLINRINPEKFEFLFIYGDGPARIPGFNSIRIPTLKLPITAGYSLALPILAQTRITAALTDFAPQVVHIATPSFLGYFGLNFATQQGLPVISVYHTHFISYIDYYFKYTPFLISPLKHLIVLNYKGFYNKCDAVYVPSESIKTGLGDIGIQTRRMQLWKRGIDTNLFSPCKKDTAAIQQLTGNTKPTVLFASRLVWEKNLETLFEVYNQLKISGPDVNFLIAGDGGALKACKTHMPDAFFTGKVGHKQLAVLYASADVFLFPSVSETYGNVVLEAMASGLPCVIADGGGSADFIEQGKNGFKCKPYNAIDYADKIHLLLADKSLKQRFSDTGLQYSGNFSWDDLAREYFKDLERLALSHTAFLSSEKKEFAQQPLLNV